MKNKNWFTVGASVSGGSHALTNTPCQDYNVIEYIGNNWGVAVVSDGAGSALLSQEGSKFTATLAATEIFRQVVIDEGWLYATELPSIEKWSALSKEKLLLIYEQLKIKAEKDNVNIKAFSATLIVVIFSPFGLLITHIGDGRACYLDNNDNWHAMLQPHRGEEINETVFLTTNLWLTNNAKLYDKPVPETRIINTIPKAFAILSDGCEYHSFICSKMNNETNKWNDPNTPYPKFFNPLVQALRQFKTDKLPYHEIKQKWTKFLEAGNEGLKKEPDDKTIILGIFE